jgi:hypothetical protein
MILVQAVPEILSNRRKQRRREKGERKEKSEKKHSTKKNGI